MPAFNYAARAIHSIQSELAKKFLSLISIKKSNLALSADVNNSRQLLEIAEKLGSEICLLKTHIDLIEDFTPSFISQLLRLAKDKNFLILEDRKFADIGNTVKQQYQGGIYKISSWADFVTVHSLPGAGIIKGLKAGAQNLLNQRGAFLLAQMSSEGNLLQEDYQKNTLQIAHHHRDFIAGFIAQQRLLENPDFIYLSPGVHLSSQKDDLGQIYRTPEIAIKDQLNDVIIVGRAIIEAENPLEMAKEFRHLAWQAYEIR